MASRARRRPPGPTRGSDPDPADTRATAPASRRRPPASIMMSGNHRLRACGPAACVHSMSLRACVPAFAGVWRGSSSLFVSFIRRSSSNIFSHLRPARCRHRRPRWGSCCPRPKLRIMAPGCCPWSHRSKVQIKAPGMATANWSCSFVSHMHIYGKLWTGAVPCLHRRCRRRRLLHVPARPQCRQRQRQAHPLRAPS